MSKRVAWENDGLTQKIPSQAKDNVHSMEEGDSFNHPLKKSKKQTKTRKCINYFNEFTANTSLHGLKYLGEEKRSFTEKVWWAVMFSLSLITCTYLILKVWHKWQTIPVIVSFAEKSTPIWQMPFPAITICSEAKFLQSAFNYTEIHHSNLSTITGEKRKQFDAISLVCAERDIDGELTTNESAIEIITELALGLDIMMIQCDWKSEQIDCSDVFTPIMTDEGLCYSFNLLNVSEIYRQKMTNESSTEDESKTSTWTLNKGYANNIPLDTYPRRAMGSGAMAGLSITFISLVQEIDYLCRGPTQGYKLSLHTPGEIPRVSQEYIRIPNGQEVIVGVKPNVMSTSDGLLNYDPKKRHCYFPAERQLKYFKEYTKKNCDLECISNYTAHVCGCVSFFMPRDPSMKICSTGSKTCVNNVKEELLMRDVKSEMASYGIVSEESETAKQTRKMKDQVASQCDCLPGCTSINYDTETSQSDFDWANTMKALNMADSNMTSMINLAVVTVFFKQSEFIKSIRSELYGQTDFLANCGGLLGLCLGFSVLSLIEIIYFITLRLFCNIRNRVSKNNVWRRNSKVEF